jgi:hypothetical protein
MAREGGGVPYTPNLVPQINLDVDHQGLKAHIRDLERFLDEELDRLETAIITSTVQAAYGALTVDPGPAPDQPLVDGVPTAITGFNNHTPAVPNRVTVEETTGDSLIPEEGGIYQILATISSVISSGTEYSLTVFINGTPSGVFTRVDASNQTASISLVLYGMLALNPGDVATLVAVATGPGGPHTWIIESAIFGLTRISERNDEPGLF